jgi:hypothetical protein
MGLKITQTDTIVPTRSAYPVEPTFPYPLQDRIRRYIEKLGRLAGGQQRGISFWNQPNHSTYYVRKARLLTLEQSNHLAGYY